MKQIFLFITVMLTAAFVQAQSLQAGTATVINDRAITHYSDNYRTTACGPDSVLYALQKATGLQTISVNSATSAQALSQYFDCPQSITINGGSFYAFKEDATGGTSMNVSLELYLAGADSLPTGAPLASATVLVDTTFGGGLLSVLIKHGTFTPVTMTQPYCMVVSNPTPTNMVAVVNDYTTVPGDGASEWLAGANLFGLWTNSYDLVVGGTTFDADFLIEPHVEYDLTAAFSQTPTCVPNNGTGTWTNGSSPILGNRMYSVAAFLGIEAVQYTWNFGDGSPSVNAIDTNHTYTGPAGWTVTLTDTLFGWTSTCTDLLAQSTGQPPVAGFTSVESGFTSTFTSTSTGDAWLSHFYTFGDGNFDTIPNPVHTYAASGTYTACLIVSNSCGADTICQQVTVACPTPVAGFTSIESGFTSTFTSTSTGDAWLSHFYDFGDGSVDTIPNPVHTYAASGTYTACLIVSNSCGADTICQQITIANPVPSNDTCGGALPISCGAIISGDNLTATANDAPSSCTSSGNGVWYTFTGDGSIVTLTTCSPNTDFDTEIIVVSGDCNNQVCEVFNDDDFGCANGNLLSTVTFASTPGTDYFVHVGSYFQDFGLGNFELSMFCAQPCSIDSLQAGTQGACDGITDTYSQDVVVIYSVAPATGTLDVNGQSFAITGSPQTVTLTGLTADGLPVDVTAEFSADGSCPFSATGLFTAPASCLGSCDGKAALIGFPTDVCANSAPIAITPAFIGGTYGFVGVPGPVDVPYIIGESANSFSADSLPLSIPDNVTPGASANIFVSGVDPNSTLGSICMDITHTWDGDLHVTLMNPAGTAVDLMARPGSVGGLGAGCSQDDVSVTIVPGTGNDMENVCITGVGIIGEYTAHDGQDIASFSGDPNGLWVVTVIDSAAGDVGTLDNFTLNFGTPGMLDVTGLGAGTYDFTHTYSTCDGCVDIDTISFNVLSPAPVAGFTESANNLVVDFTDASAGSVDDYLWDFGDGNTSVMMNPQHTYATGGTYTVCLTVSNSCGADSSCSQITVTCPAPVADWSSSATNLVVDFTDASTGTVDNYLWDFGDGNTSVMMNPQHTYAASGTYTVCLTVTNSCGSDSSCASVTVACAAPDAGFTSSNNDLVVDFTDASTGTVDNYLWDFGDGNTSVMMNPQHTYASPGVYTVCLLVSNTCGADTTCSQITVSCPAPVSTWSSSTNGLVVDFTDLTAGTVDTYLWDFGDGNTSGAASPQHTYAAAGTYTVCQTVINACGADSSCASVNPDIPTSVDPSFENGLSVYPNPSEGNITLELSGFETDATITVLDVTGRVVYTEMTVINQNFRKTFDLNVANGSYVLHLITDQGTATRKLEIE